MIKFLRRPTKTSVSKRLSKALNLDSVIVKENGQLSQYSSLPETTDILINYGVAGERFRQFISNHDELHIINPWVQMNKFQWVNYIDTLNIPTPNSCKNKADIPNDEIDMWIVKPYYSKGGTNIIPVNDYQNTGTHYFQRMILNRKYELRVTFFEWLPKDKWLIWKKIMKEENDSDQIAWNHHQGGTFVWVNHPEKYGVFQRALNYTETLMNNSHLSFGAVDFIVDEDFNNYFIEVNTLPGFATQDNKDRYVKSFQKLLELSVEEINEYATTTTR